MFQRSGGVDDRGQDAADGGRGGPIGGVDCTMIDMGMPIV